MPPLGKEDAEKLIRRRHPEWVEFQRRWRFLQDSLEGGNRYRYANYELAPDAAPGQIPAASSIATAANLGGVDVATSVPTAIAFGMVSDRNLVPHISELDAENNEIYALRLARTPIPKHLERVIGRHIGRIYAREIQRDGSATLKAWWEDVDGCETSIDRWIQDVFAGPFLAVGHLDLAFDHPVLPEGIEVRTRADARALGLDACLMAIILPENMIWWRLDFRKQYVECLVLERHDGAIHYRHWTVADSTLYDREGNALRTIPHSYGVVPIVRIFDRRKQRCDHVGQPRYEEAAEYQKAVYNKMSEQTISDIIQAHPLLQAPPEFVEDGKVTVGPTNVLPMGKNSTSGDSIEWVYTDPPKGAADAIRQHMLDMVDAIDRSAALTKPAGATQAGTVAQSGISKSFDNQEGNDYLTGVAAALERAEHTIARMALTVLADGPPSPADLDSIRVVYARQFDLATGDDLANAHGNVVTAVQTGGELPETTREFAKRMIRVELPGLPDERLDELYAEIDDVAGRKQEEAQRLNEATLVTAEAGAAEALMPSEPA